MKLVFVIPAFNESIVIYKVVKSLPQKISAVSKVSILVVDDGSSDNTSVQAKKAGAIIVRHEINRGAGAATKTGLIWAKKNQYDIAITFDADGQHNPGDIPKLVRPIIEKKADLVLGSRFKNKQSVPVDRYLLNWGANLITFIMFGTFSTDSQSGLRAFAKKAINKINFQTDRMEFSSEILIEAKKSRLRVMEVSTSAIYSNYARIKGQKNTNAIPILARFIIKFLR